MRSAGRIRASEVQAEVCDLVFLPVFLSASYHLGPSAVPCKRNEHGDAKNTDAQMERAVLDTILTYVLAF